MLNFVIADDNIHYSKSLINHFLDKKMIVLKGIQTSVVVDDADLPF